MKKILFLVSLLFTVVCFASPPPDLLPDNIPDRVEFVVQDNVNPVVFTFDVQEVAFNYLDNYQFRLCTSAAAEKGEDIAVPKAGVIDINCMLKKDYKPPLIFSGNNQVAYNSKITMLNTNYGYQYIGDNKI